MAKVVKYCAACEEGFPEKFGFCPNCAGSLSAYEMNPVGETKPEPLPVVETAPVAESRVETVSRQSAVESDEILDIDRIDEDSFYTDEPETEKTFVSEQQDEPFVPTVTAANGNGYANGNGATNKYRPAATSSNSSMVRNDSGYHITFVEERNASGRNLLLLGAFLLVTTVALGGLVYSLFTKNAMIGALGGDSDLLAYVGPIEPEPIEEEPPMPKEKPGDQGGGGGGGKENPDPVSKGRLPTQVANPIMPPQPLPQLTNPSLPNPNQTQGNIKREKTDEPVGSLSGALGNLSSGGGAGGGIGNGRGTGVGNGRGTGEGNGIGSGSGNGNGDGNGDGTGNGDRDNPPPPKPKPVAPPVGLKIISKPRPAYTDAARQNQVTGVVRLRVTFLASGQVGSVAPVSGLSYGLTEQAIAAAKQIRFEPAKVNGVAQTVTKQIEYSFSIY